WPLQYKGDLAVCNRMLGKIVVDDQRVHAVVHEPLAHGGSGEWREILVGGRVGGRRGNDDCVRHRASFFEDGNQAGDARLLLTDGNVDAVEGPVLFVSAALSRLVQASLIDDGVDADACLAR